MSRKPPTPIPETNEQAEARFQLLPLDRIRPSSTNPRKHFDEAALAELAASLKAKGMLEPMLVRPLKDLYELVAGERRYRAATLAGMDLVPCIIHDYTDQEALEVQVIENEQRQDVTPLEKADGYAALVEQHGVSVEDLAQRVGKSASTIRGLLKLRALPDKARKAMEAGQLPASTGELIARVPSLAVRQKVADYALTPLTGYVNGRFYGGEAKELPSFRDLKEYIHREHMVELKGAAFPRKSLDLVEGASSCDACPKRTGNATDEYPDARADVCTDPPCYRSKLQAWQQRERQAAAESGRQVLDPATADKIFYGERLSGSAPYFDLAEQCWEDKAKKKRSYKQLVGEALKNDIILAFDRSGHKHALVPKGQAIEVLQRDHGLMKHAKVEANGRPSVDASEKARRAKEKREGEVNRACVELLVSKAEKSWELLSEAAHLRAHPLVGMLRALLLPLAKELWAVTLGEIVKRRGKASGHYETKEKSLKQLAEELDGPGVFGLLAEMAIAKTLTAAGWSSDRKASDAILRAFGIDRKQVEAGLKADKKPEKKTAPSTNGHPKNGSGGLCGDCGCVSMQLDAAARCPSCAALARSHDGNGPAPRREATPVIDRNTSLAEIYCVPTIAASADRVALASAKLDTVGDLLDRAAQADPLKRAGIEFRSDVQCVYATLREVSGLSADAVYAIGDALIDARVIGRQKDTSPITPLANGTAKKRKGKAVANGH